MLLLTVALNLALPLVISAQLFAAPQENAPQGTGAPNTPHALRISTGDLLELTVFDTPELSGKLRVNDAGQVSLPVAGAIKLSGMTAEEAAAAIEEKLRSADVLKYPHASVFIAEYATQGVTVTGEVKNPGIYPLLGSHTVLELISAAGGVTATASKAVTITHKSDPTHPVVIQLENNPGSVAATVDIRPGDTIAVSRSGVVYVVGDVGKPGGYLIENSNRLTVLQAISLAQGLNRTAAQNRAKLIRKTATGREEVPLALKKVFAGSSPDVPLQDCDILFVPSSNGKVWAYRGMESAFSATSNLVILGSR